MNEPISKRSMQRRLARTELESLRQVLQASQDRRCQEVADDSLATEGELAQVIVDRLWWQAQTLYEKTVAPKSLEEILSFYATKLELQLHGNGWEQLQQIRSALIPAEQMISVDELPDHLSSTFNQSQLLHRLGLGAGGSSFVLRWGAQVVNSKLSQLPIPDAALRLIPGGLNLIAARTASGMVARVAGPVGVGLTLWSAYRSFGPKWDACLPLLLGSALVINQDDFENAQTEQ